MRKTVSCFLLVFIVSCVPANRIQDLRQFPNYRLGLVQVGWIDPSWRIDIWINAPSSGSPSFTLLPWWQKEWKVETSEVSVYAEAWIWDRGQKLVIAKTKKIMRTKVSVARDWWYGYGWRIRLNAGDFVISKQVPSRY